MEIMLARSLRGLSFGFQPAFANFGVSEALRRPLDDAHTVHFTIILLTFPGLGGAPETARCCSDPAFYNILSTFPGLGGALETAGCCSDRVFYNILLFFLGLGGAPETD